VQEALQELQDQVFLILIEKNKIVSDETKLFLKTKTLRYKVINTSIVNLASFGGR